MAFPRPTRHALTAVAVVAAAALAGGQAVATAPTVSTRVIDTTRLSASTSAACGTDVFVRFQGTLRTTLFRNQAGLVIREEDISSDLAATWSAPALGTSFRYRIASPEIWEYPGGAAIGSPAILSSVGVGAKVPGANADSGRVVLSGVVVDFDANGVPLADVGDFVSAVGSPPGSTPATRCAALR